MARKVSQAGRSRSASPPAAPRREQEIVLTSRHLVITAVAVVLLVLVLVGVTLRFSAPEVPSTAAVPPPGAVPLNIPAGPAPGQVVYPRGTDRLDSTPEGFPMEGPANAPVTILEFSDFQCPYCRIFAQDILPKLREKYIQPGKVRIIWRDLAARGPESEAAGAAGLCAHEQGRFWPYHDLLFARQQGQNEGAFSAASLKAIAAEVGRIQPELFAQCIDTARYLPAVKASSQDARVNLSLTGTPTFFVNGQKIEGALDWERWDDLLKVATQ